jgi:hypothetical protein
VSGAVARSRQVPTAPQPYAAPSPASQGPIPLEPQAEGQRFATTQLTIVSATGRHHFIVELVETSAQMTQGLMFRRSLARDAGMLFDYKEPTVAKMWMRNTLIPLDMLFVDAQGRIANVYERAVPQSLDVIAAIALVRITKHVWGNGTFRSRMYI